MSEVAVITGASAGIGRATVREFAKHGCMVWSLHTLDEEERRA